MKLEDIKRRVSNDAYGKYIDVDFSSVQDTINSMGGNAGELYQELADIQDVLEKSIEEINKRIEGLEHLEEVHIVLMKLDGLVKRIDAAADKVDGIYVDCENL